MILFKSENANVLLLREYKKNTGLLKKVKRSSLIRQLKICKTQLCSGTFYIEQESNKRKTGQSLFSKEKIVLDYVPLGKKIPRDLLIKPGTYIISATSVFPLAFSYKHKIVKNVVTLQEEILIKEGTLCSKFIYSLQEFFKLKILVRRIYPQYLLEDNKLADIESCKLFLEEISKYLLKKIQINKRSYVMDLEKIKVFCSVFKNIIEPEEKLSEENKSLKEALEKIPFVDILSLFDKKVEEEPIIEKKIEVIEQKEEQEEDMDFF